MEKFNKINYYYSFKTKSEFASKVSKLIISLKYNKFSLHCNFKNEFTFRKISKFQKKLINFPQQEKLLIFS